MSSNVLLTDEVRKIPYFSLFSEDEKEVSIPRPLINESINLGIIDEIETKDLVTIIENRVYLGFDKNKKVIRELLWRFGETEEKLSTIKDLSYVVKKEVETRLLKTNNEYIYGLRCRIDCKTSETCEKAAFFGNLKLLKWARESGCPWDELTCVLAAGNGHLEVLKYARENGCPWDEDVCSWAAEKGHLEVLKWARENGCPWNGKTYVGARKNTKQWIQDNGNPHKKEFDIKNNIYGYYGILNKGCPQPYMFRVSKQQDDKRDKRMSSRGYMCISMPRRKIIEIIEYINRDIIEYINRDNINIKPLIDIEIKDRDKCIRRILSITRTYTEQELKDMSDEQFKNIHYWYCKAVQKDLCDILQKFFEDNELMIYKPYDKSMRINKLFITK